jgi:2-oxoglutarate dehydrogenase E2 component (dihydrolipoamide succinyltransferase)
MSIELTVPAVGESITEVEIGDWLKSPGDAVRQDESIVSLETEKTSLDLPSPISGVLIKVLKQKGEWAKVGEVIAQLEETAMQPEAAASVPAVAAASGELRIGVEKKGESESGDQTHEGISSLVTEAPADADPLHEEAEADAISPGSAMRRAIDRREDVVPMSLLRRRVAERLVQAQQNAALLTTFNEIDMTAVKTLRQAHQGAFRQRHTVKLGLMSFFVKSVIEALKHVPELNAEIRGTDIVYRRYYDIGIAIGGGRGLVVPVLRNAEHLGFAEIETAISDFSRRAQAHRLALEELQGGTFTISNGGVYGSLLSTPIVNPPQSGVLGLHAIEDRAVVRDGQIVIRPMMYVALTYDHRIVDGREAVTFLKHVKECIEEPSRILLEI